MEELTERISELTKENTDLKVSKNFINIMYFSIFRKFQEAAKKKDSVQEKKNKREFEKEKESLRKKIKQLEEEQTKDKIKIKQELINLYFAYTKVDPKIKLF